MKTTLLPLGDLHFLRNSRIPTAVVALLALSQPALATDAFVDLSSPQLLRSNIELDTTGLGGSSLFAPTEAPTSNLGSFSILINPGATLAGNAPALAAFNRAADQWEAFISDGITVTIDADLGDLGSGGIIGSASSVTLQGDFNTIRDAMVADSAVETDDTIVASLPTAAQFDVFLPTGITLDGNISATKANLKALNFGGLDTDFGATDATITFNTQFSFDYDNTDGVGAGLMDFETVAAHEIGHALGFVSEVDYVDFLVDGSLTAGDVQPKPLDLFRFRDGVAGSDPSNAAEFTTGTRDLATGTLAITDFVLAPITGEGTEHAMSTGRETGDGQQASHWKADEIAGPTIGLMDPTLAFQQITLISDADLRALDLIGYDIVFVPEPSTLAVLVAGLGAFLIRRRR